MNPPAPAATSELTPEQFDALALRLADPGTANAPNDDEIADMIRFLFLRRGDPAAFARGLAQLGAARARILERVEEIIRLYESPTDGNKLAAGTASSEPQESIIFPDSELIHSRGIHLIRKLGAGGGGDVYLARLVALDRAAPVALKLFPRPFTRAEDAAISDLRDARALFGLREKNIVEVYGGGYSARGSFVTMEYVPGIDLNEWIAVHRDPLRRQLPERLRTAARCIAVIAQALHVVHTTGPGITHYDVKPHNILGCPDSADAPLDAERLKLGDFGVAEFPSDEPSGAAGGVGGTWGYMAPEQITSHAGPAADVFGLGMTLLNVVVGYLPFTEEENQRMRELRQRHQLARAIRGEEPRREALLDLQAEYIVLIDALRSRLVGVNGRPLVRDPVMRAVIARCVSPCPEERYSDAACLADDLRRYANDRPTEGAGYDYAPGELLVRFSRRCRREGEEFEPDRRTAWGMAFLCFGLVNLLVDLLDRSLTATGLTPVASNIICNAILIGTGLTISIVVWTQMQGRSLVQLFFPAILAYAFAASMLIFMIVPDDLVLLTELMFVLLGFFACNLGLLSRDWRRTGWMGVVILGLSPMVWCLGQRRPDLLERWGTSLMGWSMTVFFFLLGSGYIEFGYICRTVYQSLRTRRHAR